MSVLRAACPPLDLRNIFFNCNDCEDRFLCSSVAREKPNVNLEIFERSVGVLDLVPRPAKPIYTQGFQELGRVEAAGIPAKVLLEVPEN